MSIWLVEPRDPLIARDGRPIGNTAPIETMRFPFPSTLAGAARTRMGSVDGAFVLHGQEELEALKQIRVAGPLLVELDRTTGRVIDWLFPAPRDAVLRSPRARAAQVELDRLVPRRQGPGSHVDSLNEYGLVPMFSTGSTEGKPYPAAPAFWSWPRFSEWLSRPTTGSPVDIDALGIPTLPTEVRLHVAMTAGERVSEEGNLFQSKGLRFLQGGAGGLGSVRHFALSIRSPGGAVAGRTLDLREELAPLGGERRLARWRPAGEDWPSIPAEVREQVCATRRARLILVTPAIFQDGALPAWSLGAWCGGGAVVARVRAACVPAPQVVSGWDLAADNGPGKPRGRPKPTRRAAPAGSVYFVDLEGGTERDVAAWLDDAWLQCVSDAEQDRRDGFGLAVVGVWPEGVME